MNLNTALIDNLVSGGVHALPTQEARAALVEMQRLTFMDDVARQAAAHGITSDEVMGAHAMLGVRNLDGIDSQAIADAVEASKAVKRNDVAVIAYFAGNPTTDAPMLAREIESRGATARVYDGERVRVRDGELWYAGENGADDVKIDMPEAVVTRGVPTRRMQPFEDNGVHMANRASVRHITLSKNAQAPLFHGAGVSHPRTFENLSSVDEVRAAVNELGGHAVVKTSNGAGGRGVWIPKNVDELEETIAANPQAFAEPKPNSLLVQEYLDVGGADDRVTVARNAVTGEYDVVSVHHRQGLGDSGIANGPEGSLYTRVPMSEVDEATKAEGIKAAKAIGLDYAGIDVVTTSSGRKVVLEGNGTPGIPELDVPLPREEHSMPHIADWLVYGTRPAS